MPRRIDEGHGPAVLLDAVGADVLGDAPLFMGRHVDADDAVQERGLAVVDVAQEGDDRRPGLLPGRIAGLLLQGRHQLVFQRNLAAEVHLDSQFDRQQLRRLGIDVGGDVADDPHAEQFRQDGAGGDADGLGESPHRAGERHHDLSLAGGGRVRAGAADVRASRAGGRRRRRSSSSPAGRRAPATRLRFSCRCSRPPSVLGASFSRRPSARRRRGAAVPGPAAAPPAGG